MLVKEVLRIPPGRMHQGDYGVELEVEGDNLPTDIVPRKRWRMDEDGSLRGESYEYVMPVPLSLEETKAAIYDLRDYFDLNDATIHNSVRAGTHVHVNVQDFTMKQMFTFITLFFLLEEPLVEYCGETRVGNLFTLRGTIDAEYVMFQLKEAIRTKDLHVLDSSLLRYCSLNVCSLFKYGSIEFRSMRGVQTFDDVYEWVEVLDELKKSSFLFNSPDSIVSNFSGEGEDNFIRKVLPTKHHLIEAIPNYRRKIRQGVRRIQMLAFATNWDDFDRPNKNPFPKFRRNEEY